jgi:hypothetical protein
LSAKAVRSVCEMDVSWWIRRSGIDSAMEICEGGTDSGMLEIEVEESKGGTGGKGRGRFRGCVGESGFALSSAD